MRAKVQVMAAEVREGVKDGKPWRMVSGKCFDVESNDFLELDIRDKQEAEFNALVGKTAVINVSCTKTMKGVRIGFAGQVVQAAQAKAA